VLQRTHAPSQRALACEQRRSHNPWLWCSRAAADRAHSTGDRRYDAPRCNRSPGCGDGSRYRSNRGAVALGLAMRTPEQQPEGGCHSRARRPCTCRLFRRCRPRNRFRSREGNVGLLSRELVRPARSPGEVLGPVDIGPQADCVSRDDAAATTASLQRWYTQADAAAAAGGIDFSLYDRRVYVMH
jgi:hypothetical protein